MPLRSEKKLIWNVKLIMSQNATSIENVLIKIF